MEGLGNENPLYVAAYIVASNTSDGTRRSYSTRLDDSLTPHNSIFWGTTDHTWDLDHGRSENGTKVRC